MQVHRAGATLAAATVVAAILVLALGAGTASAAGPRAGESSLLEIPDVRVVVPERSLLRLRELRRLPPRGWFGLALSCDNCNISRDDEDSVAVWRFPKAPTIYSVEPDSPADKGGIVTGEKLTHIDGTSITSKEGGRRFGAVRPGDKVAWTVEHHGKKRVVTLVAEERPDRDEADVAMDGLLKETMGTLQSERMRMLAERDRMNQDLERQSLDAAAKSLEATHKALESLSKIDFRSTQKAIERDREASRHLRYRGNVGDSKIEVRGSSSVVVTESRNGEELVIDTPEATIRIEKK
jgi:hypothetical protein